MIKNVRAHLKTRVVEDTDAKGYMVFLDKVCSHMELAETFVLSNEVQVALDDIIHSDGFAIPCVDDIHLPHKDMVVQTRVRGWDSDDVRRAHISGDGTRPIGYSILMRELEDDGRKYILTHGLVEYPHRQDPFNTEIYASPDASALFVDIDQITPDPNMQRGDGVMYIVSEYTEDGNRTIKCTDAFDQLDLGVKKLEVLAEGGEPMFGLIMILSEGFNSPYRDFLTRRMEKDPETRQAVYDMQMDTFRVSLLSILRAFAFTLVRTGVTHVPMQATAIEKRRSPTGKVTKRPRKYNFTTVVLNAVEQVRGRSVEPIEHRSAHLVRGHFKQRKSGLFWWNPFVRGKGKLNKREAYQVTALEEKNDALRR
jgi:hypothetical protein